MIELSRGFEDGARLAGSAWFSSFPLQTACLREMGSAFPVLKVPPGVSVLLTACNAEGMLSELCLLDPTDAANKSTP